MIYVSLVIVLLAAGGAAAGPLDAPGYAKSFTCRPVIFTCQF
jgi:hypothetical protein